MLMACRRSATTCSYGPSKPGPCKEYWVRYQQTMSTNDRWSEQLARQVVYRPTSSRGKALGLLRASGELTKADISAGFCGTPMTLAQLRAKYCSGPGRRAGLSNGIVQGQKQPSSSRSSLQS